MVSYETTKEHVLTLIIAVKNIFYVTIYLFFSIQIIFLLIKFPAQSKCSALAHEIYTDCINPCPQGSLCTSPCISGCICEKGYDRVGGKCVKKSKFFYKNK